ncbi:MAG: hypothetical protein ACTSRS_21470 [Candidatus Helarchaeota archaeon]
MTRSNSLNYRKSYNSIKSFNGIKYTGMRIGSSHRWIYNNGTWNEIKIKPDEWQFEFNSIKSRTHLAPPHSGAFINSQYHWLILAQQKVIKLDDNSYNTFMYGSKFKLGHKLPNWKKWDYEYKNLHYIDKIINILQNFIDRLKALKKENELLNYLIF